MVIGCMMAVQTCGNCSARNTVQCAIDEPARDDWGEDKGEWESWGVGDEMIE